MATTRDRLLAATNEGFRRHGFHATSVKAVTVAADATMGSLYHHFPGGKDELAEAVLVESGAAYLALFEAIAAEAADPGDAVSAFFDGAADVLESTDFAEICPIGTVAREVAATNKPLRAASHAVISTWTEAAASLFADAGVPRADATALALTVIAALEGGFLVSRTARDGDVLRAIGRRIRTLVDLALADGALARR